MKAKCKDCGEVNWLLEKTEKRSYYAIVNPKELRGLERVKYKEVSPYTLVCGKCDGSAETHADLQYTIKEKPLKVIWQASFWDNLSNQSK